MSERLQNATNFPPVETALREPNGLLAMGGDLSLERLLDAYRHGIFPWFNPGEPILWWSPDPRMVLVPGEIRVTRSLAKRIRNGGFEVRVDTAFADVMRACAAPRLPGGRVSGGAPPAETEPCGEAGGTWISPGMIAAYTRLFDAGYAHSVESWRDGRLVGGLYGVAIGRMFYGESMFSREADASKVALVRLARQLQQWDFGLIDCQMETAHLASLGARTVPRTAFTARLTELVNLPHRLGPWTFNAPD
ncbi:leucyl/phenylalanyl-tRNA--protein transferase [Thiobacillus sp.]|jgi:leucyl/phenylalanyl-tRNA--protein transferase|uniref:leucyl/phenylalanyl-tRNA--protein transferase n=1 Tax=Thiobacillus sp. TaxID=924 RepID=UPI0025D62A9C|nr:leucyl/phenylalanyl-tRNA--protein transferase [Thiobacillus sp.]